MGKTIRKFIILSLALVTILGPMPGNSYKADAVTRQQMAIAAVAAAVGAAALTWFVVSGRAERAVSGTRAWMDRQFPNTPGSTTPPAPGASTGAPSTPAPGSGSGEGPREGQAGSEQQTTAPGGARAAPRGGGRTATPAQRPAPAAVANLTCTSPDVIAYSIEPSGCREQITILTREFPRGQTLVTPALNGPRGAIRRHADGARMLLPSGLPGDASCRPRVRAMVDCLEELVRTLTPPRTTPARPARAAAPAQAPAVAP